MDSLEALAASAPQFSRTEVERVLRNEFGQQGQLVPLVSERDQNFRLTTADGEQFVFKIANAFEPPIATDFQVATLLHLEEQQCPVATPKVIRTLSGDSAAWIGADAGNGHRCRLVSYVPGELLSSRSLNRSLASHLGESAAQLDLALDGFAHDGEAQVLLWDLQRASELRQILNYIDNGALRGTVRSCLDDFDERVSSVLPELRGQVIHADLNPENVLTTPTGEIAGVIDFGDMLHAPLIMEVAIAAAYLRPDASKDVLAWVAPCVAAYHSILRLYDEELDVLYDLLRVRVAASITILCWRAAMRGANDAYSRKNLHIESDGGGFLEGLAGLGRVRFQREIQKAIKNK